MLEFSVLTDFFFLPLIEHKLCGEVGQWVRFLLSKGEDVSMRQDVEMRILRSRALSRPSAVNNTVSTSRRGRLAPEVSG